MLLAIVGPVFSAFWSWEAYGRRGLINEWRRQVLHLDGGVDPHGVYLRIATCGWVAWFNDERLHGGLDDLTPAEVERAYYRRPDQATAA